LNEEPNVGHPYGSRDRYDDLLPVPNGDADDAHERLLREDSHIASNTEQDVLAENDQKRCTSKGQVRNGLKRKGINKHSFLRLGALGGMLTSVQTVMAWDRPLSGRGRT
jgi:hypothetical protein